MKAVCIIPGDCPDPTILREGKYYYMTCSSLSYYPGLLLYRSEDLKNWKPIRRILKQELGDIWAPELVKHKGRFYLYFPAHDYKTGHISDYVVWADDIEGEWSDPSPIGVTYQIDPGFVTDGENCWLYFNNSTCARLSDDLLTLVEKPVQMKEPWEYPKEWETQKMNDESPKLFYKNGYYYMITAQGGTAGPATSHMAVCFRAKTPLGEWEVSPYNPVIHTYSAEEEWWSTGHATYFEDEEENGFFVFHGYKKDNQNMGRQILLCRAKWTDDGFPIAEEIEFTDIEFEDFYDDFKGPELDINWSFYRNFDKNRVSFDNGLMLKGSGSSIRDCWPMTLNSRFVDYEAEVTVGDVSTLVSAGISVFYNEKAFVAVYMKDGNVYVADAAEEKLFVENAADTATLKIVKKDQRVRVYYSVCGNAEAEYPEVFDVTGYQHNVLSKFLSCRVSLIAFGEGSAKFNEFSYKEVK